MKFNIISLAVLLLSLLSEVQAQDCANNKIAEDSIFKSLENYLGRHQYDNCKVELHLCEEAQVNATLPIYLQHALSENLKFWIGDLLVTEDSGVSIYLPIYGARGDFPNTKMVIEDSENHFSYFYKDKNSDPVSGFKESYHLKINKQRRRLELSMETSKITQRNPLRSILFPDRKITCTLTKTENTK